MYKKLAFTLVELIVVITILAILGTISFVSIQNFSKDVRDSKRVSDIRSIYSKVNIENIKGTPIEKLIETKKYNSIKINGDIVQVPEGVANFTALMEDGSKFKDPLDPNMDYPMAYSFSGEIYDDLTREFVQIATISEVTNTTKIFGNYYKLKKGDSPSLFVNLRGNDVENEGEHLPYYPFEWYRIEPCDGAKPTGQYDTPNGTTFIRSGNSKTGEEQTDGNTIWQNSNPNDNCYYKCKYGYAGINCTPYFEGDEPSYEIGPETTFKGCTGNDIVIRKGDNTGYIMSSCNAKTEGFPFENEEKIEGGGRYYTYEQAKEMCPGTPENPWRLPTLDDFCVLIGENTFNGTKKCIGDTGLLKGLFTDDGITDPFNMPFSGFNGTPGESAYFWTSDKFGSKNAIHILYDSTGNISISSLQIDKVKNNISVRCIKDVY